MDGPPRPLVETRSISAEPARSQAAATDRTTSSPILPGNLRESGRASEGLSADFLLTGIGGRAHLDSAHVTAGISCGVVDLRKGQFVNSSFYCVWA